MKRTYTLREDNVVFYAEEWINLFDNKEYKKLLIMKSNYVIKCKFDLFTCDRFFKDEDWFE